MKTINQLIALFFLLTIISCSKDDSPKKEYFPTKINNQFSSSSYENTVLDIEYDYENRISKYTITSPTKNSVYDIAYSTDNKIVSIFQKHTNSSTSINHIYNFIYTNDILSQIISYTTTDLRTFTVYYNNSTNTFSIPYGTFSSNYYTFDTLENLNKLIDGLGTTLFTYSELQGVFNSNNNYNNLAMMFSLVFSGINSHNYSSVFFSNKELENIQLPSGNILSVTNTRNSKQKIEEIIFTNSISSEVYLTTNIEYEQRTIN